MTEFPLTLFVNVSVSAPPIGAGRYNTSNLAIFTRETPGESFGSAAFKNYIESQGVAEDFGSSNKVTKMAQAVFRQKRNILVGGGQLVVIPLLAATTAVTAVQHIAFPTVPTDGTFQAGNGTNWTGDLANDITDAALQTALRAVTGAGWGSITVVGDETDGFDVTFIGVTGPVPNIQIRHNSLQDTNGYDVVPLVTTTTVGVSATSGETLDAAIVRTKNLVQYFGVMQSDTVTTITDAVVQDAADVIQELRKISFFVSYDPAAMTPTTGTFDKFRLGTKNQSRGLIYEDDSDSGLPALLEMAGYASRALSTDFSGVLTVQTMNLKTIEGSQPDPAIDLTDLDAAKSCGADAYINMDGGPVVVSHGANSFFDQVYNSLWLGGALQVAGFNYLKLTDTKIPQTESGMDGLKGAYRGVLKQGVTNGYLAPGTWTSDTTFGNKADFLRSIAEQGYYLFSIPIAQQVPEDREDRKAPLVQIAAKEAGALHSSNVIVTVNP